MPVLDASRVPIIVGQNDGQGEPGGREHYSRIAAQWLRRAWRVPDPRLMGGARDLVETVERALRQRARRRVAAQWTARGLAATTGVAAAAAIVLALRGAPPSPDPTASRSGPRSGDVRPERAARPAADGPQDPRTLVLAQGAGAPWALSPGADVSATRGEPVRITSAEGTELVLEAGSSLTVVEVGATRRFALLRGAVRAQVHELRAGDRFLIDTADTEVEVHGTRFRVETGVKTGGLCEAAASASRAGRSAPPRTVATRVSVQTGIVAVRSGGREDRLLAGDAWPTPAPCTSSASPPSRRSSGADRSRPIAAHARPAVASAAASAPAASVPAPPPTHAASSELAAQNDLFSAAVAARRSGRTGRALGLYQQLVDRYPDSSLVESALAARMRVLAERGDGPGAQAAAVVYLARFPDGFARAEARALRQPEAPRP